VQQGLHDVSIAVTHQSVVGSHTCIGITLLELSHVTFHRLCCREELGEDYGEKERKEGASSGNRTDYIRDLHVMASYEVTKPTKLTRC